MKELSKIKNYIYGKGIMSQHASNSIIGIHKGKQFKIFYSNKHQLTIEINKKKFISKDNREIVRLLNS